VQLLQLADAASSLAGGSSNGGILSNLREGLGLDDLDLQTDEEGNAAVRAGRYLSDNIYTDVTIGAEGESELSLNIDLTPRHHRARQLFLQWRQRDRRVFRARLLKGPSACLLTRLRPRDISRIHDTCPGGGIGRRAGFRCQWPQGRGGSSPLLGTSFLLGLPP
jgi:hypothetical protein